MTASAAGYSPPPSTMAVPDVEYIVPPSGSEDDLDASPSPTGQRRFKKHKLLPHPRNGSGGFSVTPNSRRTRSGSQSHHTLRHQRRMISGGDLPPTPPAHSRTSSSSHSVNLSILSPLQTPAQSSEDVPSKTTPSTPPSQRSPPTPDVTPPQPDARPRAQFPRPPLYTRIPSKSTTDSRTESFKTARESPVPSDEEDGRSTLRPAGLSARTSQATVRQFSGSEKKKSQTGVGTGPGPGSNSGDYQDNLTPKSKGDFISFDGEWGPGTEVEQEWDDNLRRNVTVRKQRPSSQVIVQRHQVVDYFTAPPTNAKEAVRALPLQGRILTYDHSESTRRSFTAPEVANIEAPNAVDVRRFSGMSSKSTASTVVEAILVEAPPRQHKTLRHVKRVHALRDSIWQSPPLGSAATIEETRSRQQKPNRVSDLSRESYASNTTLNSIASRKARREVWKNGGIPVVVVPDRRSSNRSSSQEHSLRSTSSKRSGRSQSLSSGPLSPTSKNLDMTPYFDRPSRRGRPTSGSDGSSRGDQRTMDFPPVVPWRTSSLSAPTSRNASRNPSRDASRSRSRAGSLTSESLKAHNTMQSKADDAPPVQNRGTGEPSSSRAEEGLPIVTVRAVPSQEEVKSSCGHSGAEDHQQRHLENRLGSPMLSALATPFSQTSMDTNGTHAEISQAMAVSIVPHQNRSVLMVDHRPSDGSDGDPASQNSEKPERPIIITTGVNGVHEAEPVTPTQAQAPHSLYDVDSPLRNPRAPPEPPAIKFIPATPSGLTPAEEKTRTLGNFYEEMEKPARERSVVRRTLSKRRHSYGPSPVRDSRPGFLTRTFSMSRSIRKDTAENPDVDEENGYAIPDGCPRDETRLHPDWRPSHYPRYYREDDDGVYGIYYDEEEIMRWPAIDNRPLSPKRSISERMKRTFAIMPLQDSHHVYDHDDGLERRIIKRTPSGNSRVFDHRGSMSSLRRHKDRPSTAPEGPRRPFWPRSNSLNRYRHDGGSGDRNTETDSCRSKRGRRWSLSQNVQALPRKLSEKRREKRSNELRQKISGPRDVRDGVGDLVRREDYRDAFTQPRRVEHDVNRFIGP